MKKGYRLACIGYTETSNVITDNILNWSSSEYNGNNAVKFNFNASNVNVNNNNKTNNNNYVRAVLALSTKPIATR